MCVMETDLIPSINEFDRTASATPHPDETLLIMVHEQRPDDLRPGDGPYSNA
jgi:hypothetical protein